MARGQRENRDRLTLVVALALHGTALLGVRALGVRLAPPHRVVPTVSHDEFEVDLSELAFEDKGGGELPAPVQLASPEEATPAQRHNAKLVPPPAPRTPEQAASVEVSPAEPEPEAAPTAVAGAQSKHPIDLGLGPDGWQRWALSMPKTEAAEDAEPRGRPLVHAAPASSTGGLQEGLELHDRALGIGPAGRVASALYEAAHAPDAPETGSALFNVTVLKTGAVEVSLGESSDKRWAAVAARAAEALRRSPPRIPPPRSGYRVVLHLTAEETLPNGTKRAELHGARIEAVAPRFHDVKTEQREIALKNPTATLQENVSGSPMIVDLPGVYVTGHGKVCDYRFGITPFGLGLMGGCDLSNAGAKLQRVVRTEVRDQTAF